MRKNLNKNETLYLEKLITKYEKNNDVVSRYPLLENAFRKKHMSHLGHKCLCNIRDTGDLDILISKSIGVYISVTNYNLKGFQGIDQRKQMFI